MKKLYLLFLLTPFLFFGQQHGPNCTHEHIRGEILQNHNSNGFHPIQTQNKLFNTIPYQNSFENGFGDITLAQTGSTNYNWVINSGHFVHDDDAAAGGQFYIQQDDFSDSGALENWVITPTFDLSSAGAPTLNYWDHVHWASYADEHHVMYSTDYDGDVSTATWTIMTTDVCDNANSTQSNPTNAWCEKTYDLPSEANLTIAFKYAGDFASDWLIDDIQVFDNSVASADWEVSVAGTTATLSIVDLNSFTVGTDGHWHYSVDGGDTVMVYDTNDVIITGLTPGSHYITAWLVDNNHNPLDPAVETTIQFNVVLISDFPWCDSFEAGDYGYGVQGWTSSIFSGTTEWAIVPQNYNGSAFPLSGDKMAGFYSGNYNFDTASIISPAMDLSGVTNPQLTFNYNQIAWAGDQDQLRVFYRTSHDGDWVQIAEYLDEATSWTEVTLDLPNPSSDYYIGFQATSGYGYGVMVDDVCVNAEGASNEFNLYAEGGLRYQYEVAGYRGVGPGGSYGADWWNSQAYEDFNNAAFPNPTGVNNGMIDDIMFFTEDGGFTFDTGEDGTIVGKKPEIDAAFDPSGENAYDADNEYNEYWNYPLDDFTDTYTLSNDGTYDVITFETVGALGFYTAVAPQSYQILQQNNTTMYVRNVGSEGNSWYSMLTTDAHALSTSDNEILDMMVYPNPVDGNYVTILSPVEGLKEIQVFTVTGRKVMDTTINGNTLDVSSFNSGFYMLKVTINGQSKVSKLVVR